MISQRNQRRLAEKQRLNIERFRRRRLPRCGKCQSRYGVFWNYTGGITCRGCGYDLKMPVRIWLTTPKVRP